MENARLQATQSEVRFAGIANGRVAVIIKLLLRAGLVLLYLAQVEIARVCRSYSDCAMIL